MSDFMQQIIGNGSRRMDEEFAQEVPGLIDILLNPEQHDSTSEKMGSEGSKEQVDHYQIERCQSEEPVSFQSTHSAQKILTKKHQIKKKSKRELKQSKRQRSSSEDDESQDNSFESIKKNKKYLTKPGYPTKNFSANFKKCHFNFLDRKIGSASVDSIPFAYNLRNKSGISLKDYEILYKIPEFQHAFEEFFACKELFRYLMLSRSILSVKLIHSRKINLFQKAFLLKEFTHIN